MQGFNMGRYRPYDVDPTRESFNARTGTHALGKRGRKEASEGVLIVRFELPFNVWCDACEAHIGQGVRFNAEKRTVGAYFSTPIYSFRCKKTCCQTWMEVQTDPKRARYTVTMGAREQAQWEPNEEEDGVIVVQEAKKDDELDAFAAVEKRTIDKQRANARQARLEELQKAATARSADPYTLNVNVRNKFRKEKKERLAQERQDEELRQRIGWNSEKMLLRNDERDNAVPSNEWAQGRDRAAGVGGKRITTPFRSSHKRPTAASSSASSALAARLIANTRKKTDPFLGSGSK